VCSISKNGGRYNAGDSVFLTTPLCWLTKSRLHEAHILFTWQLVPHLTLGMITIYRHSSGYLSQMTNDHSKRKFSFFVLALTICDLKELDKVHTLLLLWTLGDRKANVFYLYDFPYVAIIPNARIVSRLGLAWVESTKSRPVVWNITLHKSIIEIDVL
jgi:hypothetical protein